MVLEDGRIICKRCNGKGEYRVRFYYKDKHFYYYSSCGHCYARGYNDWIELARGRKPGMAGLFCDTHPAGSCMMMSKEFGGCRVYDGHHYIHVDTKRGEALWNHLVPR
jgi:hypothetical protein